MFSLEALVFLGRGLVGHVFWVFWWPVGPCVAADVLVVLLGCLPGRLGRCL